MANADHALAMSHVGYEATQMTRAATLIGPGVPTSTDDQRFAWNAALESALLHARALIDFMLDGKSHDDDIRPGDFYPGWSGPPPAVRTRLDRERKLLHKHLVHLTWKRVAAEPAAWDHFATVRLIIDQLGSFADHLSSGLAAGEVDPKVVAALRAPLMFARGEMQQRWPSPIASVKASTTYSAP
jgi:hypothetical protein